MGLVGVGGILVGPEALFHPIRVGTGLDLVLGIFIDAVGGDHIDAHPPAVLVAANAGIRGRPVQRRLFDGHGDVLGAVALDLAAGPGHHSAVDGDFFRHDAAGDHAQHHDDAQHQRGDSGLERIILSHFLPLLFVNYFFSFFPAPDAQCSDCSHGRSFFRSEHSAYKARKPLPKCPHSTGSRFRR